MDGTLKVLATGFEPFGSCIINSSWESVKELKTLDITCRGKKVCLEIAEIEVCYEYVTQSLPNLWEKTQPDFCIHVGLSSASSSICLERIARNNGYFIRDNRSKLPPDNVCQKDGKDTLQCLLNVSKICQNVRSKTGNISIEESHNAGQYLCDFTYYSSLYLNRAPVLFVHIPPLDKPYTKSQLAETLKHIIEEALLEITA